MQSKINNKKNASYFGFLQAIGENDLPAFSERQEEFIKYVSEMLPIVRPYEYLIIQTLVQHAGRVDVEAIIRHNITNNQHFDEASFKHALKYMLKTTFFKTEGKELILKDIGLDVDFSEYSKMYRFI